MRDKLVLRFLGFLETMKYILEQSHGVPPVSVALDHTTLKEEGSCGYSSVKTVRSIARGQSDFFGRAPACARIQDGLGRAGAALQEGRVFRRMQSRVQGRL